MVMSRRSTGAMALRVEYQMPPLVLYFEQGLAGKTSIIYLPGQVVWVWSATGNIIRKVAPWPSSLSKEIEPP